MLKTLALVVAALFFLIAAFQMTGAGWLALGLMILALAFAVDHLMGMAGGTKKRSM